MKKSFMKRLVALALVIVSVFSVSAVAFAESNTINAVPGEKRTGDAITFTTGADISVRVSCFQNSGDIVRVFLDVYDPDRGYYVERDVVKFTSAGYNSGTLYYDLDSNENLVRIRTYGYEANSGTIIVIYNY